MDSKRLMVRYADDVGSDGIKGIDKDGVIELRRNVPDLSLGESRYSQVRILVDGTHYLKGMAVYSDDMPDGVDVIFNTNKKKGTPALGPKDNTVLKPIKKDDPENPFGSLIKDPDKGGQYYYKDPKTGEEKLGLLISVLIRAIGLNGRMHCRPSSFPNNLRSLLISSLN